jgi:hypothetical protein
MMMKKKTMPKRVKERQRRAGKLSRNSFQVSHMQTQCTVQAAAHANSLSTLTTQGKKLEIPRTRSTACCGDGREAGE